MNNMTFNDDVYTTDTGSEYTINISSTSTIGGIANSNLVFDTSSITNAGSITSGSQTITIPGGPPFIGINRLDLDEVAMMCDEYPGLKNVYEKFKHIYDLVKQDWVGKQNESK